MATEARDYYAGQPTGAQIVYEDGRRRDELAEMGEPTTCWRAMIAVEAWTRYQGEGPTRWEVYHVDPDYDADELAADLMAEDVTEEDVEDYLVGVMDVAPAEAAKAEGRPELTGTEKQVAWAESIRHSVWETLIGVDELLRSPAARRAPVVTAAAATAADIARRQILDSVAAMQQETAARWWIDHRSTLDSVATLGTNHPKTAARVIYEDF